MKLQKIVVLFALIALSGTMRAQHPDKADEREQLHFSAEDETVRRPASVPQDVLTILEGDRDVAESLKEQKLQPDQLPISWFLASKVHLHEPGQSDLIVVAAGALMGANVTKFWVFGRTAHGSELLLAVPAHDLIIRNSRWQGYRSIEAAAMTASTISTVLFRFNGSVYEPYRTSSEKIP
ncbi:MAG: hypothetical protein WAK33_19850 [Silvibacterium sp.]